MKKLLVIFLVGTLMQSCSNDSITEKHFEPYIYKGNFITEEEAIQHQTDRSVIISFNGSTNSYLFDSPESLLQYAKLNELKEYEALAIHFSPNEVLPKSSSRTESWGDFKIQMYDVACGQSSLICEANLDINGTNSAVIENILDWCNYEPISFGLVIPSTGGSMVIETRAYFYNPFITGCSLGGRKIKTFSSSSSASYCYAPIYNGSSCHSAPFVNRTRYIKWTLSR